MFAADAVDRFLARVADRDDAAIFTSIASGDRLRSLARVIDDRPAAATPLRGRVFAVDDTIDVVGLMTTAACPSFAREPAASARVVQQLARVGAIPVAKTNIDQFATGLVGTRSPHGTPRNPRDPSLVPGGSSSGAAVAVAAGLVDFALGTDAAGSACVPAAMCAVVGMKSPPGLVSMRGVVPSIRSVDTVSVFARELWLADDVLGHCGGFDPADPFARRPPERTPVVPSVLRVGVVAESLLAELGCSDTVIEAYLESVAELAYAGARVQPIDLAPFLELGDLLTGGPWLAERTAAIGDFLAAHPDDIDETVAAVVAEGAGFDAVAAHRADYRRRELARRVEAEFVMMDVLLLPTIPGPATRAEAEADPRGVDERLGRFTTFANLADLGAVSIPAPPQAGGVPGLGVTVYAPAWHDRVAVTVAEILLGDARPATGISDGLVSLCVAGAHLRGEALDTQLIELGAVWEQTTTTAPTYRLWAMHDTDPPKPALVFSDDGAAVEVDVWRLDAAALGRFLQLVPPPLALGTVDLADGRSVTGFVAEPRATEGAVDITDLGGWRAYEGRSRSLIR